MFKEYYKKVLVEAINKAANKKVVKDNSDILELMDNLSYLSESEDGPSGKRHWIPLHWKRIFVKAAWGMDVVVSTKLTTYKENVSASAATTILLDGKEVAYAESHKAFDTIAIFDSSVTNPTRNVMMKQYAMGSSERLAYYRLGVCMNYTGDIEELEPIVPENQTIDPQSESDMDNAITNIEKAVADIENIIAEEARSMDDPDNMDSSSLPTDIEESIPETTNDGFVPVGDDDELPFTSEPTPTEQAEDFSIALVGPENIVGRKLTELEPKFIACLAANIANKKPNYDSVSEAYYNHVMEIINSDESGTKQKLYHTYLKK